LLLLLEDRHLDMPLQFQSSLHEIGTQTLPNRNVVT